jgi:hypothetical protein
VSRYLNPGPLDRNAKCSRPAVRLFFFHKPIDQRGWLMLLTSFYHALSTSEFMLIYDMLENLLLAENRNKDIEDAT